MITVYDTACGSKNLGDQIIMESVMNELAEIFPRSHKISYPTHYPLSNHALKKAWGNELAFVGGTNILRSKRRYRARRNQWALAFTDARWMTPAVLMGVGSYRYSGPPDWKAKWFYKRALSERWIHSVRDQYTLQQLSLMGVNNVLNTGCPTIWQLSEDHCNAIPQSRARNVVFSLTDYNQDPISDTALIKILVETYEEIFFWPQGSGDLEYFSAITNDNWKNRIKIIPPCLGSFDKILEQSKSLDYVGTRLHAGIRALQKFRRSIIIGIDNRAIEKQKDFNIPVCFRDDTDTLVKMIEGPFQTQLTLPKENIATWKLQFYEIANH